MSQSIVISSVQIERLTINMNDSSTKRRGGIEFEFVPINPDPTGAFHPVRPTSATTGTICATIRIDPDPEQEIEEVRALVYDFSVFSTPDLASQPPLAAVAGKAESGNRWSWGGASGFPEIPHAVHNSAGNALNVLAVWKRAKDSTTFVYDGRLLFTGKTGIDAPCGVEGGGSGGSGSNSDGQVGILIGVPSLDVTVEGEKGTKVFKAKLVGPMVWETRVDNQKLTITFGNCGKRLVLRTAKGEVVSNVVSESPFKAVFPPHAAIGNYKVIITKS